MRYFEFNILLEYDRSKTSASFAARIQKRAASDTYLKSKNVDPVEAVLSQAEETDPTPNKQYVVWIVKQYVKNKLKYEDIYKLQDLLSTFVKTKGQHKRLGIDSDINQYHWRSLASIVDKLDNTDVADDDQAKPSQVEGAKVLYNGPLGMLSVPETEEASCELGRGTKWCTAAQKRNMFNYYNKQGPLYIWHDKKYKEKFQFHFETGQFMDDKDDPIDGDIMHYLTSQNPVTSKLFKKKAPLVIKHYVNYLEREPDDDISEEILDTNISAMVSNIPFKDAVKLIKTALRSSDENSDNFQLRDALFKRFEKNPTELNTVLQKHNNFGYYNFEDAYKKYKLKRAPKEDSIKYIIDNKDDPYMSSYALELATKYKTAVPELEPIIMKNPQKAYLYAYHVLKQQRFKEAEPVIAKDPWAATYYVANILKQRWPEAEEAIKTHPKLWDMYIDAIKD